VAESKVKNLIRGDVHKFRRLSGASIASCPRDRQWSGRPTR
jgi:hypothetical protein